MSDVETRTVQVLLLVVRTGVTYKGKGWAALRCFVCRTGFLAVCEASPLLSKRATPTPYSLSCIVGIHCVCPRCMPQLQLRPYLMLQLVGAPVVTVGAERQGAGHLGGAGGGGRGGEGASDRRRVGSEAAGRKRSCGAGGSGHRAHGVRGDGDVGLGGGEGAGRRRCV